MSSVASKTDVLFVSCVTDAESLLFRAGGRQRVGCKLVVLTLEISFERASALI